MLTRWKKKPASRPQASSHAPLPTHAPDALAAACRLVWNAQGLAPAEAFSHVCEDIDYEPARHDPVRDIAQKADLPVRPVHLQGDWWTRDNGPLLAFVQATGTPLALIPRRAKQYVLHDPVQGSRTRVTKDIAATLHPTAYLFYHRFPQRALTAWELLRFGQPHRLSTDLMRALLAGVAGGLLSLLIPAVTESLFQEIIPLADQGGLVQITMILVASALAAFLFQTSRSIALLRAEGRRSLALQAAVWDRLLHVPASFFRRFSTGDLADRANGLNILQHAFTEEAMSTIFNSVFSIFNLGLLFYYAPWLACVAILLLLAFLTFFRFQSRRSMGLLRQLTTLEGSLASQLLQLLHGVAKWRVAGADQRAFARYEAEMTKRRGLDLRMRRWSNLQVTFNAGFPHLAAVVFYLLLTTQRFAMDVDAFLAFNAAFGSLLSALIALSSNYSTLLKILPLYERAKPLLTARPEGSRTRTDPGLLSGAIELKHVTFRYQEGGRPILDNLSLHIRPGEFVALVGPSDSGKTTLLRLLLGLESPEDGAVCYDGFDLTTLDLYAVRAQMGVVLQKGSLLPGSLLDNLIGTRPSALTEKDAWEALEWAGLSDDIRRLPHGLDTQIEEVGNSLSNGQCQRLQLARALIRRPRFILLDEATSALDNKAQANVAHTLERYDATRIVVAHRLSTIRNADRILVLDQGRLVQVGTFDGLLHADGLFRELAQRQLL